MLAFSVLQQPVAILQLAFFLASCSKRRSGIVFRPVRDARRSRSRSSGGSELPRCRTGPLRDRWPPRRDRSDDRQCIRQPRRRRVGCPGVPPARTRRGGGCTPVGRRDRPAGDRAALIFATMNASLYTAMSRIGLGTSVTLEFLGPLAVALLSSRRVRHSCTCLSGAGLRLPITSQRWLSGTLQQPGCSVLPSQWSLTCSHWPDSPRPVARARQLAGDCRHCRRERDQRQHPTWQRPEAVPWSPAKETRSLPQGA